MYVNVSYNALAEHRESGHVRLIIKSITAADAVAGV